MQPSTATALKCEDTRQEQQARVSRQNVGSLAAPRPDLGAACQPKFLGGHRPQIEEAQLEDLG